MPFWDAAYAWGDNANPAKREWKNRNVWTTVDTAAPIGVIDGQDKMVKLSTADDQAATDILPYLALGGGNTCNVISGRFSSAGDFASAALVSGSQVECAKSILRYILGADLFNERGLKTGYPPATQDEAVDRDYILGDVFHSSPVVVQPPLPRKGVVCKLGLENQCIIALWDTDTEGGPTGYDAYSLNARYVNRRKVVLVGANDGMLHAFNGGEYVVDSTHPLGGYYETGQKGGEAKWGASATFSPALELWAFIPPDLLSKLPLFLGSEHQLFVDGTPMVRDVWVDGSDNEALAAGQVDDVKEGGEFHTMAVVGERRGGTRFFALDITDATEPGSVPRFRWIYPQPNAAESLTFGETYDDFLPQPPPIGPVRIAADGSPGNGAHAATPRYGTDGSDLPFHERWVAFLSGGFDLQYARGRGVHMVDVWTGKEIFDFSYPDAASPATAGDPRFNLRFPIPAVVGMIRWGPTENAPDRYESRDNYFDTATFGDAGGQVWTLRFHVPGTLGSDGRVTNWFGARALQMGGQTDCKLCGAQPFFYMTANSATPGQRHLRTYLGTGDRFNLMDKYGGTCGPNNLRACIFRGCTVTVTAADNVLSNPGVGFAQRGWSEVACAAIANTGLDGPATGCTVEGKVKVAISACPSPEVNNGPTATAKQAAMSCLELADGYSCTRSLAVQGPPLSLSQTSNAPTVGNWFFSLRMFQDGDPANANTRPVFKTLAEAKVYDDHRLYVTQNNATRTASPGITLIDSASNAPAAVANEESQGWATYYNHSPTVTIDSVTVNVDWKDERTSSGTTLAFGALLWNTLQPPISMSAGSTSGSCRLSKCTQEDRRLSYLYGADPVTGGILQQLTDATGAKVRSQVDFRPVPPPPHDDPWFINEKGQVKKKPTRVSAGGGAEGITGSEAEDPVTEAGILLIDKELYMCRHAETPVCK
jgi:type IV pilus assembly protein PilY1